MLMFTYYFMRMASACLLLRQYYFGGLDNIMPPAGVPALYHRKADKDVGDPLHLKQPGRDIPLHTESGPSSKCTLSF